MLERCTVAVIGAGYWGPNLVRNFRSSSDWDLVAVCDLDRERATRVIGPRSTIEIETSVEHLLARDDLDAVAIATPAHTHAALAIAAFDAGKHVLVEKPLAHTVADAEAMIAAAERAGRVLMADHTFCYTPAVIAIRDLIADGELGELLYIDSVRINLGLVQPDVNVFWDLAPHDLSILDFILPGGIPGGEVSATGADPLGTGKACVGVATLRLPGKVLASLHLNWLSPTKIRQFVVGGSRRTLVWDDLNPLQRVAIFDRGVDVVAKPEDLCERRAATVSYRMGEIIVPVLQEKEALASMVAEYASAIRERRAPLTDGYAGLRVLNMLTAFDRSLETESRVSLGSGK